MDICVGIYTYKELEQLHTRQLLRLRKNSYTWLDGCDCCSSRNECICIKEQNLRLLKEVLSTRPNIPNKRESKAIRKARIKKGK